MSHVQYCKIVFILYALILYALNYEFQFLQILLKGMIDNAMLVFQAPPCEMNTDILGDNIYKFSNNAYFLIICIV